MFGLNVIGMYVVGGIVALLVSIITVFYFTNTSLKKQVKELETSLVLKEVNERTLNASIDKQNNELQAMANEYALRIQEYNDKAPIVVKRYVDRIITKEVNVTRSSCEDVNNTLNNIRSTGF
jgi:biopolymer transport protein ExbB/TolQ